MTPMMIYSQGIIDRARSNYLQVREILDNTPADVNLEAFGLEDGQIVDRGDNETVNVLRPFLGLNGGEYVRLLEIIQQHVPDVTLQCDDNGIRFYTITSIVVNDFLNNRNT